MEGGGATDEEWDAKVDAVKDMLKQVPGGHVTWIGRAALVGVGGHRRTAPTIATHHRLRITCTTKATLCGRYSGHCRMTRPSDSSDSILILSSRRKPPKLNTVAKRSELRSNFCSVFVYNSKEGIL